MLCTGEISLMTSSNDAATKYFIHFCLDCIRQPFTAHLFSEFSCSFKPCRENFTSTGTKNQKNSISIRFYWSTTRSSCVLIEFDQSKNSMEYFRKKTKTCNRRAFIREFSKICWITYLLLGSKERTAFHWNHSVGRPRFWSNDFLGCCFDIFFLFVFRLITFFFFLIDSTLDLLLFFLCLSPFFFCRRLQVSCVIILALIYINKPFYL